MRARALGFVVGSMLTPLLVGRVRPASLIAGGLALGALGFMLIAQVDGDLAPLVVGLGDRSRSASAPVITLVDRHLRQRRAAGARGRGVGDLRDELGARRRARHRGARRDRDRGLPRGRAGRAPTRRSASVTDPALLDSARDAFTQGLQVASSVAAAVLLAAAIVAVAALRRVPAAQPAAAEV